MKTLRFYPLAILLALFATSLVSRPVLAQEEQLVTELVARNASPEQQLFLGLLLLAERLDNAKGSTHAGQADLQENECSVIPMECEEIDDSFETMASGYDEFESYSEEESSMLEIDECSDE